MRQRADIETLTLWWMCQWHVQNRVMQIRSIKGGDL